MKFLLKKIIRKLYHLISFLTLFLIFSNNVSALTQCNSQGAESTLKEMPLLVFVGNGASHGREYRFYTMDRAYTYNGDYITGSWNYQSYQKLCSEVVGSNDSSSNFITFRVSNYTYLVGNIYTITFSMTDVSGLEDIDPTSAAAQNLDMIKILSAEADPRDLVYYLTISFYVTSNYSGTSNFVFYSNSNLQSTFNSVDYVYTPYITTTPRYIDNTSSFNSIKSDTQSIINGISQQQQSINQLQQQQQQTNEKIDSSTEDIKNNQNENTEKEIESQKVCKNNTIDYSSVATSLSYLDINGRTQSSSNSGITDYISIDKSSTIVINGYTSYYSAFCFYDENKTQISCSQIINYSNGSNISIPDNAKFFRSTIYSNNSPTYSIKTCTNGNQALDDTLNDSSVDSSDDTLSNLQDNLPTNSVISDILLLPVRLLQAIINSLGGTCSSFNLGSLYGTNLVMPCIDIEHYVGSAIWTFIDLVFSGMFVLVIRKKFIQIWENITNLKGGGNEVD